jgi:hypothetical protein
MHALATLKDEYDNLEATRYFSNTLSHHSCDILPANLHELPTARQLWKVIIRQLAQEISEFDISKSPAQANKYICVSIGAHSKLIWANQHFLPCDTG